MHKTSLNLLDQNRFAHKCSLEPHWDLQYYSRLNQEGNRTPGAVKDSRYTTGVNEWPNDLICGQEIAANRAEMSQQLIFNYIWFPLVCPFMVFGPSRVTNGSPGPICQHSYRALCVSLQPCEHHTQGKPESQLSIKVLSQYWHLQSWHPQAEGYKYSPNIFTSLADAIYSKKYIHFCWMAGWMDTLKHNISHYIEQHFWLDIMIIFISLS